MTTKNLIVLGSVAVVLGGVACWLSAGKRMKAPSMVGRRVLPAFELADVSRVDIAGAKKVTLVASDAGWKIDSLYGYPADVTKIRENLLKLQELKVGQVANGRTIGTPTTIELKKGDAPVAKLVMGEAHLSRPKGQAAQFGGGGYPDGRYVQYQDKTVLVKETLDAFDGDPRKWTDTRIASVTASDVASVTFMKDREIVKLARKDGKWTMEGLGAKEEIDTSKTYSLDSALSYLDFTGIADPKLSAAELGLTTGAVYTATLKNGLSYVATVGNKTGGDRWVKLAATFKPTGTNATENAKLEQTAKDFNAKTGAWTYAVSSYSADNMSKTRKDLVKAKEEPKKDDVTKDDAKKGAKAEAKKDVKAEAKKDDAKKDVKADVKKDDAKKGEKKQ
ncbi:MAG: DUF4340 domain-containing protein [Kiritimatiellia bacterium]